MCDQLTLDLFWVEPAAPQHDAWKRWRKRNLPNDCYATDIDSVLIDRSGLVALLEFKTPKNTALTYTQQSFFDEAVMTGWDVFRVVSETPFKAFVVEEYLGGGEFRHVLTGSADDYRRWEIDLRQRRRVRRTAEAMAA